jgi:hypothetical protein
VGKRRVLTTVGVLMALTPCAAVAAAWLLPARIACVPWLVAAVGLAGLLASYHMGLPAGPVITALVVGQVAAVALARPVLAHRHSLSHRGSVGHLAQRHLDGRT